MVSRSLLSIGMMCLAIPAGGAQKLTQAQVHETELVKQSGIVFLGTVQKLRATSFAEVPKSERAIVVTVDTVLKKPEAISLKKGDSITVDTKDLSGLSTGMEALFYTEPWLLGSGVAVKELAHVATSPAKRSEVQTRFAQLQEEVSNQDLRDQLSAANVVILGTVVDVRQLPPAKTRVSEHNPMWEEAIIQVDSSIKGTNAKQVIVRFPASRDVAWFRSPKFQKGEEKIFFLQNDRVSGSPTAKLGGLQVTPYTALSPNDVRSPADEGRVRSLLKKD